MTTEERQTALRKKAAWFRQAANMATRLKPVIQSFDGIIYNCRFDDAIKQLSDDDYTLWVDHRNGFFAIDYMTRHCYRSETYLMQGYDYIASNKTDHTGSGYKSQWKFFSDNKRIDAAKMIQSLNDFRADLLHQAYELEKTAEELPETLAHIAMLRDSLEKISRSIPISAIDIVGVAKYRYLH